MLKRAMELASSDEQKALVLKRASAIRSLETLRFVAPYMDQPEFTQLACKTVVELAHHKDLRQPNKAEFNKALDKVIAPSKDPEVLFGPTLSEGRDVGREAGQGEENEKGDLDTQWLPYL